MNIAMVIISVLSYLAQNKQQIRQAILDIETLIPDAPGSTKAAMVRQTIGIALDVAGSIDQVWPMIAPLFNLLVADVKGKTPPAAAA